MFSFFLSLRSHPNERRQLHGDQLSGVVLAPGERLPGPPVRPDPVPRFLRRALLERGPLRPDRQGPGRRRGGGRLDPPGSGRRGERGEAGPRQRRGRHGPDARGPPVPYLGAGDPAPEAGQDVPVAGTVPDPDPQEAGRGRGAGHHLHVFPGLVRSPDRLEPLQEAGRASEPCARSRSRGGRPTPGPSSWAPSGCPPAW